MNKTQVVIKHHVVAAQVAGDMGMKRDKLRLFQVKSFGEFKSG